MALPAPLGQIRLPVTFNTHDNYCTELIDFDIARIGLPYNAILGYPVLAKFMAATHHGGGHQGCTLSPLASFQRCGGRAAK